MPNLSADLQSEALFVFCIGVQFCALPAQHVAEVMRPQPTDSIPGAPEYVTGAALIRGLPTPVVDLGSLLSGRKLEQPRRMIALTVNAGRRVALLASSVLGLRQDASLMPGSAPLLENCPSEIIAQLGQLDGALLTVLHAGRLLSDDLWQKMEQA